MVENQIVHTYIHTVQSLKASAQLRTSPVHTLACVSGGGGGGGGGELQILHTYIRMYSNLCYMICSQ